TNIIKNPPSIHNYPISQHSPGKDCGTITCSPPPKGPHGYFIPSEKHRAHQSGQASAGPTWEDGQKALDGSVNVPDSSRRVVAYGGKYIVFDQTSPGVYHGHYRPWDGMKDERLSDSMKKALKQYGMTTGNKGKIKKDMKE
ncbi:MAG: hypothetical protein NTU89_00005, partial [Candidatus Dependentiae bacterium]|nr:hypothetical protein [Candidatus Dependentiae bacterium]